MAKRQLGDYGGVGTKNWLTSVNRQLGSQVPTDPTTSFAQKWAPGGEAIEEATGVQEISKKVKEKQIEKVKGDLSGAGGAKQAGAQMAGQLVQGSGMFGDSDVGGGLEQGASYALAAGLGGGLAAINPWMLGGSILLGSLSSRSKRKAQEAADRKAAIRSSEESKMRARSEFAQGMRQIFQTSAQRRLNL
ncbi:MAG: hypothetical protein Unbinned8261contig1001_57 [Prokaryotic dsDNA virus sp.]|nr:MAG: hypothetical protein Unbinned8261contig1001_57 [Prokaryotic dsDNA virus sp.]|tara:strand:+ start:5784 stop:6353 length:570 start_codon:yes stop_codon:yes gene_type:complete